MAIVDISTGKIYGCKENSKTWWQEMGHIEFNKIVGEERPYYINFYYNLGLSLIILYLWIRSDYILFFSTITILLYWGYMFYEEAWAWNYSYKNKKYWDCSQ